MLAIQNGAVNWVHQDPVTKSQRVTNSSGSVVSTIDLDPWGGETNRSANSAFQPHKYTSYERDGNGGDDAMHRRYQSNWTRFSQPDPYDGSYDATNPQSFNRYSYVQNDPVNFVDPSGLCTFNIAISNNNQLNAQQLQAMKNEMSRIFGSAGQQINFVPANADYYLGINAQGAAYTNNPRAVGITYLSGSRVTNSGRVFVDRLEASATADSASATAFSQNSNALAIGLGRAGSHEIAHFLLQQNYDSPAIRGVMHAGFTGQQWFSNSTQAMWTFNAAQIWKMNNLCKPVTTDTSVPNTSPLVRPLIGGGGGGEGGDPIRPTFYGGGGGFGGFDSLRWLYLWFAAMRGSGGYTEVVGYYLNPPQ
jgi:RHS repeat-associated protein